MTCVETSTYLRTQQGEFSHLDQGKKSHALLMFLVGFHNAPRWLWWASFENQWVRAMLMCNEHSPFNVIKKTPSEQAQNFKGLALKRLWQYQNNRNRNVLFMLLLHKMRFVNSWVVNFNHAKKFSSQWLKRFLFKWPISSPPPTEGLWPGRKVRRRT